MDGYGCKKPKQSKSNPIQSILCHRFTFFYLSNPTCVRGTFCAPFLFPLPLLPLLLTFLLLRPGGVSAFPFISTLPGSAMLGVPVVNRWGYIG